VRKVFDGFNRDGFLLRIFLIPISSCTTLASPRCQAPTTDTRVFGESWEGVFEVVEEGRFGVDNFQDVAEAYLVI
jgi:hypothetical protein